MILSEKQLFCIHFLNNQPHLTAKRASSCISAYRLKSCRKKAQKGSITLEMAMILPVYFFAIVCLLYMMEVMAIRASVRSGMQYAAKIITEETYMYPRVTPDELESLIVQAIGSERLDRSIVSGGSGGLHCEESRMSILTGILELKVRYRVKIPVPAISSMSVPMEEFLKAKGWCGYVGAGWGSESDQTVYITENGMVYHRDYSCNYLELSIQSIEVDQVNNVRNKNQGKYHACESCIKGNTNEAVYITDYGDRYHNSLTCSGLKRTVYAIPLSEATGKGVCTKCGR